MSIIRNRELSQFGSFIYIDDNSKDIGISTQPTPYVGIGTTNPTVKFHVVGDTNLEGNVNVINGSVNASSYNINGNPLVDASILQWNYASNGTDMYRLEGNIGIGTSVISQKLTVNGNVSASELISTIPTGTAPLIVNSTSQVSNLNASLLAGKSAPAGDIVGTSDAQTLTNKTLTSPTISSILNSGTLTLPTGDGTLIHTGSVGLVTSGMIADLSITNDDVAAGAGIGYSKLNLSNSILASDIITGAGITYGKLSLTGSITNADIASNAAISTSKLSAFTISGTPLGSNLPVLSFGTYLTGTSYNGTTGVTIATNATSSNTPGTIVARDSNGDFTARNVTCTNLIASGVQGGGSGLTISGAVLNDGYTEEVFTITDGTTVNLNPNNGSIQLWTLGASRTPGQSSWNSGQSITLMIDDGSARTINWTTLGVVWKTDSGTAPTLNTTGFTVIILWKVNTVIYGSRVGNN